MSHRGDLTERMAVMPLLLAGRHTYNVNWRATLA